MDSSRLGYLSFREPVDVTGIVRLNGRNYGWCQVSFNGRSAYVSAEYLSAKNPNTDPLEYDTQDPGVADPPEYDTQDSYGPAEPDEDPPVSEMQDPSEDGYI